MRKCARCSTFKELIEFPKNKNKHLGHGHTCKECSKREIEEYHKTKKGLISAIWNGQKASSRYRDMAMPLYTKKELSEWLRKQGLFHELYARWVISGYKKSRKPSVDRIDDYVGYQFDNIQLMTFGDNQEKSHRDKVNGINTKQCKGVIATSKGDGTETKFYSIAEASRQTGIDTKNINYCCQGKPKYKSAGGYKWKYV